MNLANPTSEGRTRKADNSLTRTVSEESFGRQHIARDTYDACSRVKRSLLAYAPVSGYV